MVRQIFEFQLQSKMAVFLIYTIIKNYVIVFKIGNSKIRPTIAGVVRGVRAIRHLLRVYCIDRAGVAESHDAHPFYCLYD